MSTDLSSLALVDLVLESQSLRTLANELIPDLMDRTGANGGSILVQRGDVLIVHTAFGLKRSRSEQAEIPIGVGVTGRAAQTGNIQWIPDVENIDNFIEGVPDSTWEYAIPIDHEQRDTTLVIDLESNSEERPSPAVREQILNDLQSIELPLLNLAENERFRRESREDTVSSLMDGDYFFEYMEEWFLEHPDQEGLLIVLSLEPVMDSPKISSLRDLHGEVHTIGTQLRTELPDEIIATRLYGNLFCLFVPDVGENETDERARELKQRIEDFCRVKRINYDHYGEEDSDIKDLTNKAFVELNFTASENGDTKSLELDEILHKGEIELYQQPILKPEAGTIYGREMLVRGPEDSDLHSPKRLFEAAYQSDRVVSLDTLIVRESLENFRPDNGEMIFLNVERKSLTDDEWRQELIGLVREINDEFTVCIEITEHGDMQDIIEPLKDLRDRLNSSVRFAVDDFGTGSSNFRALIDLEPDILKIDRSLIRNVHKDFGKRSFIDSLMEFSSTTDTEVLAEGIEEEEEWDTLDELGVELAQGYYFSKPQAMSA